MRLLAMVTDPKRLTRRYLRALGERTDAPTRAPARGPPFWKESRPPKSSQRRRSRRVKPGALLAFEAAVCAHTMERLAGLAHRTDETTCAHALARRRRHGHRRRGECAGRHEGSSSLTSRAELQRTNQLFDAALSGRGLALDSQLGRGVRRAYDVEAARGRVHMRGLLGVTRLGWRDRRHERGDTAALRRRDRHRRWRRRRLCLRRNRNLAFVRAALAALRSRALRKIDRHRVEARSQPRVAEPAAVRHDAHRRELRVDQWQLQRRVVLSSHRSVAASSERGEAQHGERGGAPDAWNGCRHRAQSTP
jgi:hypothetical protein